MGTKLVVVESPAKAKTIGKILGKGYTVRSSMGHIRDLPVNRLGVDIENNFRPRYALVPGRAKVVAELKAAAKNADTIYLAPDPDREGEAIAWHLTHVLGRGEKDARFQRVQYNEITPRAVRGAFEHPGKIDIARVNAQQARRILDRIVGYKVSPVLWRRIKRGLSAGRVQSVALRLVCEREREIRDFKSEEYWLLGALVRKLSPPPDPFRIRLVRADGKKIEIGNGERAEAVRKDLEGRALRVSAVQARQVNKSAPPPYITSTLQQAGSSFCGFSPRRTMSIAQKLYEGIDLGDGPVGLITYMRTDSFNLAREAVAACRELIAARFGPEYCPAEPRFFKSRAGAQEAHEAIRPTDPARTPESLADRLKPEELKLYRLVWQRFVASQMAAARIRQRTAVVEAPPPEGRGTHYEFQATASEVEFPGYMKVLHERPEQTERQAEDGDDVEKLPALAEGEPLECLEWLAERKETQPPPRYSEASLVRALESNGVGRPSTYAQIIGTLQQRRYVAREKRTLSPTDLGFQVNDLLVSVLPTLFDVGFTAEMEKSLDEVENGSVEWTGMLARFYGQFAEWMNSLKEPSADGALVERLLGALQGVTDWAPEVETGGRVFSDERFVKSIRARAIEQGKGITHRQLAFLMRVAARYRQSAPEVDRVIVDSGYDAKLKAEAEAETGPLESTVRKLDLLRNLPLDERATSFVNSLRSRVDGKRALTERQIRALNNVVLRHADKIDGFDEMRGSLEIADYAGDDTESGPLLEAMAHVRHWKEPLRRGKRVFDDRDFFESLRRQFGERRFLSVKQRAALKRMVRRYRDQVPGYAEIAGQYDIERSRGRESHAET
ncbi:MAG: type I DNA topoisomerase [Lentisphaerae bacterium]|nr:type I DNA topoisomerase [Lentisphaerota bacterium]